MTSALAVRRACRAACADVVRVEAVHKAFRAGVPGCFAAAEVLRGATLRVAAAEFVAIIAAPGAGKSTLLLTAAGLLRPDAGRVTWSGRAARAECRRYARAHDLRAPVSPAPLLLVDDADDLVPALAALHARGVAIVAAGRDAARFAAAGARVLELRDGRLAARTAPRALAPPRLARVAEATLRLR